MKFKESGAIGGRAEFLASPKYRAINHTFTADTKSGTPVEITDGLGNKHVGICLNDIVVADNPNGAVVVDGIVDASKLAEKTSSAEYYPAIIFIENKEED